MQMDGRGARREQGVQRRHVVDVTVGQEIEGDIQPILAQKVEDRLGIGAGVDHPGRPRVFPQDDAIHLKRADDYDFGIHG